MTKDMSNTKCLRLYLWCFCVLVGFSVVCGHNPDLHDDPTDLYGDHPHDLHDHPYDSPGDLSPNIAGDQPLDIGLHDGHKPDSHESHLPDLHDGQHQDPHGGHTPDLDDDHNPDLHAGHHPDLHGGFHGHHDDGLIIPDPRFHLDRTSLVDFVIHRGCMYMSGFVRSHYVKDSHHDHDKRSVEARSLSIRTGPHRDEPGPGQIHFDPRVGPHNPRIHEPSGPDHGVPLSDAPQPGSPHPDPHNRGHPPGPDDHAHDCEWQQFIGHMCDSFHIPTEFRDALMSCGMGYSMSSFSSLQSTENMMHTCNLTSTADKSYVSAIVGKRDIAIGKHTKRYNLNDKRTESRENVEQVLVRDVAGDTNATHSGNNGNVDNNMEDSPFNIDTGHVGNSASLKTWCSHFSSKVRSSYHYSTKHSIKPSKYWVLDVYRNINKYRMPKYYAHSLIGCGLRYAMYALHVPITHTIIYVINGL